MKHEKPLLVIIIIVIATNITLFIYEQLTL